MTKLVGGVAESWTVSPDAKTFTFKLRPNQKFESGAPVTADDMAFSLQRVVLLDKTPAFLFTQLGWNKDNVKVLVKAPDASTLTFTITEDLRPLAGAEPDEPPWPPRSSRRRWRMANETNGDLGNAWLKTHSATSGPYRLVSWKANESVTLEANPGYHLGAAAHEARDRPPRSRARHAAPAAGEGRHRHRAGPDAGPAQAAGRQQGHQGSSRFPAREHLVHAAEPGRRAAEEPEGPRRR